MKKTCIVLFLLLLPFSVSARSRHYQPIYHRPPVVKPPVIVPPIATTTPPIATTTPPTTSQITLGAFNANVGSVQVSFVGWTDALGNGSVPCANPKTTFIYWENQNVPLDIIINGSQDAIIKDFGNKVCPNTILSLFHEMNGNWDSWDGTVGKNTPAKVIQAYRHIHDLLGNKVQYAWVINGNDVPDRSGNRPSDYYPGDSYVDIIGIDGFNWGGLSFSQAISPNFGIVKTYNKPIWITSFGTTKTNQSQWITDAISYAKSNNIQGLLYFSYPDQGGTDFTLTSQGLNAFHL